MRLCDPQNLIHLSQYLFVALAWLCMGAVQGAPQNATQTESRLLSYQRDIQPILNQRCVVCHSCYDAPCQLKLDTWKGLERGGHKEKVYNGRRLIAAEPTRLEDNRSLAQWRDIGFHPVLPESGPDQEARLSVLARMLQLKRQHPLPSAERLPQSIDLAINRDQQCPRPDEFDDFADDHPLWGMPYALPALPDKEQQALQRWLDQGAPGPTESAAPDSRYATPIAHWEAFLNQSSNKARLMSRYIYEHLFLANLFFDSLNDGDDERRFFRLIRSATPPGQPVQAIVTRRPYDDPGVQHVYYRLVATTGTRLAKTHMPYGLSEARQQHWQALFLDPDYPVARLPGYNPKEASNPFITFRALPVNARYRFMLEEAEFTIMGFIKGPACRGQVALNVINDYFWVFFVEPGLLDMESERNFLAEQRHNLRLPAEDDSTTGLLSWIKYAEAESDYLEAKRQVLLQFARRNPPSLEYLWDGNRNDSTGTPAREKGNTNATLTVFRHFDSASVVRGLLGDKPQTAWLVGYPTLERIHYLLVAGFDVYGNVGHQLSSRLYMDFLRMESEFNFLTLLPRDMRQQVRSHWYRNAGEHVQDYFSHIRTYLLDAGTPVEEDSAIDYQTKEPLTELYGLLHTHFAPLQPPGYPLHDSRAPASVIEALGTLASLAGSQLALFPEISFIRVDGPGSQSWYFTLLHNSAHSNIAGLFNEQQHRLPREDSLLVVSGLLGAYPNQFYRIDASDIRAFVASVEAVNEESDYTDLLRLYGIGRNAPDFWEYSDRLQQSYRRLRPLSSGLFDYSRLDNR